ncbi:MAG: isocitrate lyase/PEP mutase family protein [Burkholderiales bacterium]
MKTEKVKSEKTSTVLRRLLNEPGCLTTIWGGTAHHAQLAEYAGFRAFGVSGSKTSSWIYGMPDAGYITQTELVENVRNICNAVKIPVIVDADTGHGNALGARRTVELLIKAGAAGCFIEDQKAPKRCGFVKGKQLISLDEAVGKYRAVCDLRDELDADFIIMARTDARGAVGGSLEHAIERAKAYQHTGVDVIYAEALQTREEIKTFRAAIPDILFRATEGAIKPPLTRKEKNDLGLCMTSIHAANIATIAMYDFLVDFRRREEDAWIDFQNQTKSHPLGGLGVFDLTGFPEVVKLEEKYLPQDDLEKYNAPSLGLYDPHTGRKGQIDEGH